MVVVIFRSRLSEKMEHKEVREEYQSRALMLEKLVRESDGFVSFKTFLAEDGERVSIAEFLAEEYIDEWKRNPRHLEAQRRGKDAFYESYSVQVCTPIRSYCFNRVSPSDN